MKTDSTNYPSRDEIIDLYYYRNLNYRDLCRHFKTSEERMTEIFNFYGLHKKARGGNNNENEIPVPDREELLKMYSSKEFAKIDSIAAHYKVGREKVKMWFAIHSIEMKTPGGNGWNAKPRKRKEWSETKQLTRSELRDFFYLPKDVPLSPSRYIGEIYSSRFKGGM